ncbi:MAG: hypothetical protein U0452_12695 [Anaerolineae bacterium]
MFPIVLAHGALGPFDELLFIGVGIIFVGLMVTAWIRSRNSEPDLEEDQTPADSGQPGAGESDSDARSDHFPLS